MMKRSQRFVVMAALVAMAALVSAVPVHHAHMVHAALAHAAEPSGRAAPEPAQHRGHHDHAGHDHAPHVAKVDEPGCDVDHQSSMPRCPVCSTVQAAVLPLPSQEPAFTITAWQDAPYPFAIAAGIPSSSHFRPVQPRAPPIVA